MIIIDIRIVCLSINLDFNMEEFPFPLDVSIDADLEEIPSRFAQVLTLLHIDPYSEPDLPKVRRLLRVALYVYGSLSIHGNTLEQKLKKCPTIPKNELNSLLAKFHTGSLLSDVCERLLMTITGPNHILEIQDFCYEFLDTHQYRRILSTVRESRRTHIVEDQMTREAKFLLITTFQLKSAQEIELAIHRILDRVEFSILAWIINFKDSQTYFAMKCQIVQKELCSRLESGSVSGLFIVSMYKLSALSDDGLSIYFKCLQNRMFASSLMEFFISYLLAIEDTTHSVDQEKLREHEFHHISFLIAGMMSRKSDCRIEFHKKLAAMTLNVNVLLRINHLNLVYEF